VTNFGDMLSYREGMSTKNSMTGTDIKPGDSLNSPDRRFSDKRPPDEKLTHFNGIERKL